MNPAGASTESLTSNPELENNQDPKPPFTDGGRLKAIAWLAAVRYHSNLNLKSDTTAGARSEAHQRGYAMPRYMHLFSYSL